jgi:hypothetical protein
MYTKTWIYNEWLNWEMPLDNEGNPNGRKFMMFDFSKLKTQYWMFIPKEIKHG